MKTVNNHIVEDSEYQLLYCGMYYDNEDVVQTNSYTGICQRCAQTHRYLVRESQKVLTNISEGYTPVEVMGELYIISEDKTKRLRIPSRVVEYLTDNDLIDLSNCTTGGIYYK